MPLASCCLQVFPMVFLSERTELWHKQRGAYDFQKGSPPLTCGWHLKSPLGEVR